MKKPIGTPYGGTRRLTLNEPVVAAEHVAAAGGCRRSGALVGRTWEVWRDTFGLRCRLLLRPVTYSKSEHTHTQIEIAFHAQSWRTIFARGEN